jgi:hypothetical protein
MAELLPRLLILLGFGFLVANLRILIEFFRFRRLKRTALLIWPRERPPFYGLLLAIGVVLGFLLAFKVVVQNRPPTQVFGESMMFVYYGYALPLSLRIGRGFYEQGIWAEGGFVPYSKIDGLTWREGEQITLVLIDRVRNLARRLTVPQKYYAAARRLLRDKIADQQIFGEKTLDLGDRDLRDDV